jgi:ZIP family zinc transporter
MAQTLYFFREKGRIERAGWMVAAGMLIHDVPEGFAIASAYALSPAVGILLATSVGVHNIPEGFAMSVPFAIERKKKSIWQLSGLSALAQLSGAAAGVALAGLAPSLVMCMTAVAAGAMLFVSIDELLPLAIKEGTIPLAAAGGAMGVITYFALSFVI